MNNAIATYDRNKSVGNFIVQEKNVKTDKKGG